VKATEDSDYLPLRGRACVLLAACLEGRLGYEGHQLLGRKLELESILTYKKDLELDIRKIRQSFEGKRIEEHAMKRMEVLQVFL